MSRNGPFVGLFLATTFGVLTAYVTWRPELEEQRAKRLGHELPKREHADNVISEQMREDFREAGKEFDQEGGFAWGIRKALRGRNPFAKGDAGAQRVEVKGQDDARIENTAETGREPGKER